MHKVFARTTWSALLAAAISLVFSTTGLTPGLARLGRKKNGFKVCNAQITTRIRLGSLTTNRCFAAELLTL